MGIRDVTKDVMIEWFECNDLVNELLAFALSRELKRATAKSKELMQAAEGFEEMARKKVEEAKHETDRERRDALMMEAYEAARSAVENFDEEERVWRRLERI